MLAVLRGDVIFGGDGEGVAAGVLEGALVAVFAGEEFVVLEFDAFEAIAIFSDAAEDVGGE